MIPEEIWVAGKGPSLDTYDWSKAGAYRVGINEAALLVPNCTAAIAIDYGVQDTYQQSLPPSVCVLRKVTHTNYVYPNMQMWAYDESIPVRGKGTSTVAVQVLNNLGAKVIHFVGFDSIDGEKRYAECICKKKYAGKNSDGFRVINEALLGVIKERNIVAIWEHRCRDTDVREGQPVALDAG